MSNSESASPRIFHLVAVAERPAGAASVDKWIPFAGSDTLGALVETVNAKWERIYDAQPWLPEDRAVLSEVLKIAPYDLGSIRDYDPARAPGNRVVVLDLPGLARHSAADDLLKRLYARLRGGNFEFNLTQVNGGQPLPSRRHAFDYSLVIASHPEIMSTCDMLRRYLEAFCRLHVRILDGLAPPSPPDGGGGPFIGRGSPPSTRRRRNDWGRIARLAADLRALAIRERLSGDQAHLVAQVVARSGGTQARGDAAMMLARATASNIRRGLLPISRQGLFMGGPLTVDQSYLVKVPPTEIPRKKSPLLRFLKPIRNEPAVKLFEEPFDLVVPIGGRPVTVRSVTVRREEEEGEFRGFREFRELGAYPERRGYAQLHFVPDATSAFTRGGAPYTSARVVAHRIGGMV